MPDGVPCVSQLSYWNAMNLSKFRDAIELQWYDSSLYLREGRSLCFGCHEVSLVIWPQQTSLLQTPHCHSGKRKLLQMNRIAVLNQAQSIDMKKEVACTFWEYCQWQAWHQTWRHSPWLLAVVTVGPTPQSVCFWVRSRVKSPHFRQAVSFSLAISMFLHLSCSVSWLSWLSWLVTDR